MPEIASNKEENKKQEEQQESKKDEYIPPKFRVKDPWAEPSVHPMYLTTALDYGKYKPTKQTESQRRGKPCKFSKQFTGGMWRDNGLNTSIDKTFIKKY